jgi:hypothetical protein
MFLSADQRRGTKKEVAQDLFFVLIDMDGPGRLSLTQPSPVKRKWQKTIGSLL